MATNTVVLPGPELRVTEKDLNETVPAFAEIWAHKEVENGYLRIALIVALITMAGLSWLAWKGWTRPTERVYVRVDETGRAQTVPGASFQYQPHERELRYFLTKFAHLHFSRRRATISSDLPESLYFFDDKLRNSSRMDIEKSNVIKTTMTSAYDLEVEVTQVVLRDVTTRPFMAEIDYSIHTVDPSSRQVMRSQYSTATVQFVLASDVSNEFVQHNPIGLAITYLRTDEAFRSVAK